MGKNKSQEIDLLYINEEKKKNKGGKTKKNPPKKQAKKDKQENVNNELFQFDEEIVIGMQKPTNKKVEKKNKSVKKKTKKEQKTVKSKTKKKKSKIANVAKWFMLFVLLIGSIIYFLMSPLFNIKQIDVLQNAKISDDEIISLSQIVPNENIFKIIDWQIKNDIKQNAYIDEVKIKRVLPDKLQITVTERTTTYMIECINSYAYINNQGYILEISKEKLNVPIITGQNTILEEIKPGNRLQEEDLHKLETVIKIIETANSYDIGNQITKINIEDKNNYEVFLEGEKKIAYLGDASNINTRILYLKEILDREKGKEMLIFLNVDLNTQNVYTREKV